MLLLLTVPSYGPRGSVYSPPSRAGPLCCLPPCPTQNCTSVPTDSVPFRTRQGRPFSSRANDLTPVPVFLRNNSSSILFLFLFCLLPCVQTVYAFLIQILQRLRHLLPITSSLCFLSSHDSPIFFTYICLFFNYHWTTFYITNLFPLVNTLILH